MASAWTAARAALDPLARRYGQYTAYTIPSEEFIGHAPDERIPAIRAWLRREGYGPQFLSAAKRHPETGELHELSYRRVPDEHPPAAYNSPLVEQFGARQCQLHVHAFAVPGGVDVFSHYEVRPDPFTPDVNLHRLQTHYNPTPGQYLTGVTDLSL